MEEALEQLDKATSAHELQSCKHTFERIDGLNTGEWLPLYYVAYCDIRSAMANPQSEHAVKFLDNTVKPLEKLGKHKMADQSEVETLNGLKTMAFIMHDSGSNGQRYLMDVIASFQKAIKQNPENPRPQVLLLFFNMQLPAFIRSEMNVEEEVQHITELFNREAKSGSSPYWGQEYLPLIKQQTK